LTTVENFKNNFSKLTLNNNIISNVDFSTNYLVSSSVLKSSGSKVFLFVGLNLRIENPVLNIRFKKLAQNDSVLIGYIGPKYNYNINLIHLGNNINILNKIFEGKHFFSTLALMFSKKTVKNLKLKYELRNPVSIFFGSDFEKYFQKNDIISFLKDVKFNNIDFNVNVLKKYSGIINTAELGLCSNKKVYTPENNFVYLCGSEKFNPSKKDFIIFQGHHNEKIKTEFDIILPAST
jgi:NADH-quinone oxidoreductase subunit G